MVVLSWNAWFYSLEQDEFTVVFKDLGNQPEEITSAQMQKIEEYVQVLYGFDTNLAADCLDKFRKSKDHYLRKLPLSREASPQHTKWSCYQTGYV